MEDAAESKRSTADEGPSSSRSTKEAPPAARLAALDILRGFVMVIMSIDHASAEYNGGRVFTDSAIFYTAGTKLPVAQFFTRWITHLCAPTFVFLAGVSLAISAASRRRRGDSERAIDRHLLTRGVLLIVLETTWMSFAMVGWGRVLFQVLYAIGASFLLITPLRRLSDRALLVLAVLLLCGLELVAFLLGIARVLGEIPVALLVAPGFFFEHKFIIAYPMLWWLAIMCLGWVVGRRLVAFRNEGRDVDRAAQRLFGVGGAVALAIFVVVRGANTFGNMGLLREDGSIVQWLHVSKYPPSLTFACLELGIMALLLAALFRLESVPRALEPFRLIGQVALFYYLLHIHALALVGWIFGIKEKLGLGSAYVGGLAVVVVLFPLCVLYRRFKAKHPKSFAQYI